MAYIRNNRWYPCYREK